MVGAGRAWRRDGRDAVGSEVLVGVRRWREVHVRMQLLVSMRVVVRMAAVVSVVVARAVRRGARLGTAVGCV